jgi:hypothetical protein
MYHNSLLYVGAYVPGQCLQQPFEKIRDAGKQNQMLAKKCYIMHEKTSRLVYSNIHINIYTYKYVSIHMNMYIFIILYLYNLLFIFMNYNFWTVDMILFPPVWWTSKEGRIWPASKTFN